MGNRHSTFIINCNGIYFSSQKRIAYFLTQEATSSFILNFSECRFTVPHYFLIGQCISKWFFYCMILDKESLHSFNDFFLGHIRSVLENIAEYDIWKGCLLFNWSVPQWVLSRSSSVSSSHLSRGFLLLHYQVYWHVKVQHCKQKKEVVSCCLQHVHLMSTMSHNKKLFYL